MVMIFPKFARQLNEDEMLTEICSKDMKNQIAILDYSSKISVLLNHLKSFVFFKFSSSVYNGINYGCSNILLFLFF